MKGRENIGTMTQEMLIADATFPLDVVTVSISETEDGAMKLKRGSVLAADDSTGKCRLMSGADGATAAYVLAEPVETSDTEEVVGVAYQTGKFIRQSLIVADGYELSVKDIKDLRDAGILVESAMM